MRRLGGVWPLAPLLLAALPIAAQQPFAWQPIAGATATAVGVLWSHGYDDDPRDRCGLAHVLTHCRLERARAAVPGVAVSGMQVGGDYALAFAVVDGADGVRAAGFLRSLLDDVGGAAAPTDDQLALWIARIALAADDAEYLYPGTVLRARVRRAVGVGTRLDRAPAGDAAAIAALTPADVRRAMVAPVAARGAALGAVTATMRQAIESLRWPGRSRAGARRVATAVAERCAGDAI